MLNLTPVMVAAGGAGLFALLIFEFLVGKRVIHFKGPLHMKIHRAGAWALVGVAVVHAFLTLTYLGII